MITYYKKSSGIKTLSLALAAVQRLEVATQTSDWWDSQSDAFKEQYIEDHPRSKFAREARQQREDTKDTSPSRYSQLFDKYFYKGSKVKAPKKSLLPTFIKALDYASDEFTKQSTDAINRYLGVDTVDLTPLHKKTLKVLDSALAKRTAFLEAKKKSVLLEKQRLAKKLAVAPKEEKAQLRKEISKLDTSATRMQNVIDDMSKKHDSLVKKHSSVLGTTHTLRKQRKARAENTAKVASLNKDIARLKAQLVKAQKLFDKAKDTDTRRQFRLKLKELKASLTSKEKELTKLTKVNK